MKKPKKSYKTVIKEADELFDIQMRFELMGARENNLYSLRKDSKKQNKQI